MFRVCLLCHSQKRFIAVWSAVRHSSCCLVLEELEHAKARGAKIYAEVAGVGMSADAHHLTASHPEGLGAKLVMTNALEDAEMKPEEVERQSKRMRLPFLPNTEANWSEMPDYLVDAALFGISFGGDIYKCRMPASHFAVGNGRQQELFFFNIDKGRQLEQADTHIVKSLYKTGACRYAYYGDKHV